MVELSRTRLRAPRERFGSQPSDGPSAFSSTPCGGGPVGGHPRSSLRCEIGAGGTSSTTQRMWLAVATLNKRADVRQRSRVRGRSRPTSAAPGDLMPDCRESGGKHARSGLDRRESAVLGELAGPQRDVVATRFERVQLVLGGPGVPGLQIGEVRAARLGTAALDENAATSRQNGPRRARARQAHRAAAGRRPLPAAPAPLGRQSGSSGPIPITTGTLRGGHGSRWASPYLRSGRIMSGRRSAARRQARLLRRGTGFLRSVAAVASTRAVRGATSGRAADSPPAIRSGDVRRGGRDVASGWHDHVR
jgi:hypothetical protein